MSKEAANKAVVGRWFTDFWGKNVNLAVVDEIASPDMVLKYSLHEPRRGREDIKAFMTDFRAAFPDLNFWGTADLIAEGDYVVGQYRAGGTSEEIKFAVGQTTLGAILVASSKKGVAAILLGDDADDLVRNLQDRFPKAHLIGADRDYEALIARVVGLVEAPGIGLDLPLDVRGTAFQQRVWQALREIPVGETVCYAEIARRIGSPQAARAVAAACAANNLAIAIPCHRVVRNDGAHSEYAWGVERKRALLDREASQS